ncbi:hypothetical protein [Saccharopolyspora hattusasensis]|uniref:hypothetical protein n=1 Tax=Saccharopolyspora hattusasensis TaxID=1128679 RepID=UPI003D964142
MLTAVAALINRIRSRVTPGGIATPTRSGTDTVKVSIYHRGFGSDEHVHDCSWPRIEGSSNEDLLEAIFEEFNVGESHLAADYRAKGLRPLSVGDEVELVDELGARRYECDSVGWFPSDDTDDGWDWDDFVDLRDIAAL